jgi:hypothetical protein
MALLVLGLASIAVLIGYGLKVRPANYPGIGAAVNVSTSYPDSQSSYSLGLGLVVETPYAWGIRLALGIMGFWAYVAVVLFFTLLAPVEWAVRCKRRR